MLQVFRVPCRFPCGAGLPGGDCFTPIQFFLIILFPFLEGSRVTERSLGIVQTPAPWSRDLRLGQGRPHLFPSWKSKDTTTTTNYR